MLYHVNPNTGEAGRCEAGKGRCPFGGPQDHFTSELAARASYEEKMASQTFAKPKDGRSAKASWPDLEIYRGQIHPNAEVFVHPQGKIAYTDGTYGRLFVKKNGKSATTSGTLEDLRNGRGRWVQVKGKYENFPEPEDYAREYENTEKESTSTLSKGPSPASAVSSRYPKNSPYDESKTIAQDKNLFRDYASSGDYPGQSWGGYAILPLEEQGNPFKLMEAPRGSKFRFWNGMDSSGNETVDTTIEVWSDGNNHYKGVATSGGAVPPLGSTSLFHHDQTGRSLGQVWTLVGAFEPIEKGAILGEVPNRSMQIYTYK